MIRTLTHRAVDFVFDLVAEMTAVALDLGPAALALVHRARLRWAERREAPSWESLQSAGAASGAADAEGLSGDFPEGQAAAATSDLGDDPDGPAGERWFLDEVLRDDPVPA